MHQGHALALVGDRVLDRGADQPFASLAGDGLQSDRNGLREPDLLVLVREVVLEERHHLLDVGGAGLELDAGVHVLRVLPEDDHVHQFRVLDGGRHALEPADRAKADVEVEQLAKCHVERPDAAADGGRQRSLDPDQVVAERRHGLVGQPGGVELVRLLTRVHFHPLDLPLAAIGFLHGGIEHAHAGAPDVRPGAVTFDEREDGAVGDTGACRR